MGLSRSPLFSGGLRWLWLTILVFVLDQWTKQMAVQSLQLFESVPVLSFFNVTLVHNEGAAFSFLGDASGWQRWFLSLVAIVLSVALVIWLARIPLSERLRPACLALILGGAIGNLYDRLTMGYVIDFIDWYYQGWHWPAFNVADAAITLGAVVLIAAGFIDPHGPPSIDKEAAHHDRGEL